MPHVYSPEELFDMPFMGTSTKKRAPHWLGNILWVIVVFLCKIFTRYRVHGIEHLRAFRGRSGAVVACTHASFLDIAYMYCPPRPGQWLRLMARDTLFENPITAFIFARCGGFPVTRDSADRASIKRAVRMLKEGELVGIFPEGTRRGKTNITPEVHGGAALIARMAKVPIIPAAVSNVERVKQKGHLPRPVRVDVHYGKPIDVSSFDFLPKEERLDGCMWYVMRECFALRDGINPEQVDMRVLFPDAKDYTEEFRAEQREG
ncbi:lysophospholipid acyltransferase family protein [Cryptobacterium curtum]|uniref:lysophospholipid acyltransferase family protein n=1 Tax=Cryptobacterium curtum TaxID=84163 RepID=UPI00248E3B90|nr:lysophospholipid acyltransferase family protein [Cryptobacterium curtum]